MSPDRERRSQSSDRPRKGLSLSLAFRQSPKKKTSTATSPPVCQESVHYPIFNPRDPRHNPALPQPLWRRRESQSSSSESQRQAYWTQSLPRRSIHKARSGLSALRAGLFRSQTAPSEVLADDESPRALPRLVNLDRKRGAGQLSSGLSNDSTQEDLTFGVEMYRTGTPWPSASDADDGNGLLGMESNTITEIVSAPDAFPIRRDFYPGAETARSRDPDPACAQPVSMHSDGRTMHGFGHDDTMDPLPPKISSTNTEGEGADLAIPSTPANDHRAVLTHSIASAAREVIKSPEDTPSVKIVEIGDLKHQDSDDGQLHGPTKQVFELLDDPFVDVLSENEFLGSSDPRPVMHAHQFSGTQVSTHELQMPTWHDRPGMLTQSEEDGGSLSSITPPQQSYNQNVNRRQRDTHFQLEFSKEQQLSFGTEGQSPPTSRNCSLEVKFAFPGLYQELLQQWKDEYQSGLAINSSGYEALSASNGSYMSSSSIQPSSSCEIPRSKDTGSSLVSQVERVNRRTLQSCEFSLGSRQDVSSQGSGGLPLESLNFAGTLDSDLTTSRGAATEATSESRHSFGLHISLSETSDDKTEQDERSFPWMSFDRRTSSNNRNSLSSVTERETLGSLIDETEPTSRHSPDDTLSAEITSMTSMSNGPWSPIDDEFLFNEPFRDEYYLLGGKNSRPYPDQGGLANQPPQGTVAESKVLNIPRRDQASTGDNHEMTEMLPPQIFQLGDLDGQSTLHRSE